MTFKPAVGIWIVTVVAVVFNFACQTSSDNLPPVISIVQPYANQYVTAGDTMFISATIDDETSISRVLVQVVNDKLIPVGPAVEVDVNCCSYKLDMAYVIPANIPYHPSYSILIRAFDDSEYKNKYQSIEIGHAPKIRNGVLVITQKSPTMKAVYQIDTLENIHWLFDVAGNSGATEMWSKRGLLFLAGSETQDLKVYNVEDGSVAWTIPCVANPPHLYFTDILSTNNITYVGFEEGFVAGYNQNGTKVIQTPVSADAYPTSMVEAGDYLAVFWKNRNGQGGKIVRHYLSSGQSHDFVPVSFDVEKLVANDNGVIYAFSEVNGLAKAWKVISGSLQTAFALGDGSLLDAQYIGKGYFVVSQSAGTWIYQEQQSLQLSLFTNNSSGALTLDEDVNTIYSANANKLTSKVLGNSSGAASLTVPYPIIGVHPWYQY